MENYTIIDIVAKEKEMFEEAHQKYGEYFENALNFNSLLQNLITSVAPEAWIFVMFLSQVRKHHTLALLSTARLHHIQAMMNLRQVLEAGANAAYGIANPNDKDFAAADENGILDFSQELTNKRYKWLGEKYPAGSSAIKNLKKSFNSASTHSNIAYAHLNFSAKGLKTNGFETPYFDIEDDYHVKTDYWLLGNVALGLMDLFFGVNKDYPILVFAEDFVIRLHKLESDNLRLKGELMKNERYLKYQ
jgi:hypothetical protein